MIEYEKFFKDNGNHFIQIGVRPGIILGFTIEELYQNIKARLADEKKPLSYDHWFDKNEERLSIEAAETGADRELDFDFESFCENRYEELLKRGEQK